jgi:hypothetical protein
MNSSRFSPSRSSALGCVLAATAAVVALVPQPVLQAGEPATAAALMKQAHDGRAEWQNFSGFEARLRVSADGATAEGSISVDRDGTVKITLPDAARFAWAQRPLDSMIGHRLPTGEAISDVEFADDQVDHPHGRLLRSADPKDKTLWRVKGDVLTEVHRAAENSRFTISIADVQRTPEGKHLPANFIVTTWELPSERLKSVRQVHQEWRRLNGVDLPTSYLAISNRSDGTTTSQQIELFDHRVPLASAAR